MGFATKMSDDSIVVNLDNTNLKDLLNYCKPKEKLVLVKKFGLNGEKPVPLQQIGKSYGLTRERIRQIEVQALMRVRRLMVGNPIYLQVLDSAKDILQKNGYILPEEDLIAHIINLKKYKFSKQELKLILVSDFNISYLKRNKFIKNSFYISPIFEDMLIQMAIWTQEFFNKKAKSQNLYEFIDTFKKHFEERFEELKDLPDKFYLNFFSLLKNIAIFDGKIGLNTFADVAPKTVKLKILYTLKKIGKPIHYQELPAIMLKYFPDKPVKITTVHNELVKHSDLFVNMGLGVYGLREWGYQGGQVKEILVRVMEEENRPMNIQEICKKMLKEKMVSPTTILINLQRYKKLFQRVEKGVYQLAPNYQQELERLAKESVGKRGRKKKTK